MGSLEFKTKFSAKGWLNKKSKKLSNLEKEGQFTFCPLPPSLDNEPNALYYSQLIWLTHNYLIISFYYVVLCIWTRVKCRWKRDAAHLRLGLFILKPFLARELPQIIFSSQKCQRGRRPVQNLITNKKPDAPTTEETKTRILRN